MKGSKQSRTLENNTKLSSDVQLFEKVMETSGSITRAS